MTAPTSALPNVRRRSRLAIFLFVCVFVLEHPAESAEPVNASLTVSCVDFAIDPKTGRVAGVDPDIGELALYDFNSMAAATPVTPLTRLSVGTRPASVVFKQIGDRRYFIVGCLNDPHLYLVDADDPRHAIPVDIAERRTTSLAASLSSDDPYVYYSYLEDFQLPRTGRVNLLKRVDEGKILDKGANIEVSARGKYLYIRTSLQFSGIECFRKVASTDPGGGVLFERTNQDRNDFTALLPDPFETQVAVDRTLYDAAFGTSATTLPMLPLCFFAKRPLVAGLEVESGVSRESDGRPVPPVKLDVVSLVDRKIAARFEIPGDYLIDSFQKPTDRGIITAGRKPAVQPTPTRLRMFADEPRDRIILLRRDKASVVKLDDAALPEEPLLALDADTSRPLVAGKRNVVPVRPRDARVKLELLDEIDDLAITAEGLVWTPPAETVGERLFRFKLTHGDAEAVQGVTVQVRREGVPVPIEAGGLYVAPDGSSAALWTKPLQSDRLPLVVRSQLGIATSDPRAAVVDLEGGGGAAAGALPFDCRYVAVDKQNVYAAKRGEGVLAILDRKSFGIARQVAVQGEIVRLQPISDGRLVVCMQDGRRIVYQVPELTAVREFPGFPLGGSGDFQEVETQGLWPVAEGWQFRNGDVFDRGFSKWSLLAQTPALQSIVVERPTFGDSNERRTFSPGMHLSITGRTERNIVDVRTTADGKTSVLLVRESGNTRGVRGVSSPEKFFLELHDGAHPNHPRSILIDSGIGPPTSDADFLNRGGKGAIYVGDGEVFTSFRFKLFRNRIAPPAAEAALEFVRSQSAFLLDPAGRTDLKHAVRGGKGPYRFTLPAPQVGLEISATEGTVTADASRLREAAIDRLCGSRDPTQAQNRYFSGTDSIDAYVQKATPIFQSVVGRVATGVPVTVPIAVEVVDANARTAVLNYQVVLEIPRQDLIERFDLHAAVRAASRAAPGARDDLPPEERLRRLENAVLSLEAELKLIKTLIGDDAGK